MLDAAESGDWEGASELGGHRRDLLEALFDATEDPAGETSLVQSILRSDRKLAALARNARTRVSDALSEHRRGRRAVGAYREAASTDT